MLQLGVAGVGQRFPDTGKLYGDCETRSKSTRCTTACLLRAEAVADQEDVAWETGLRSLARRHSVEAVLLFDVRWQGLASLHCLAR